MARALRDGESNRKVYPSPPSSSWYPIYYTNLHIIQVGTVVIFRGNLMNWIKLSEVPSRRWVLSTLQAQ